MEPGAPTELPGSPEARRARGAYFTPDRLAAWMTDWSVSGETRRILEPSFGDGAFLRGLRRMAPERTDLDVLGVELEPATLRAAVSAGLLPAGDAVCDDFLNVEPSPVDAVIGNPPFVRLRHLPTDAAQRAVRRSREATGRAMEPSGSLWFPFVLHATRFLRPGGRLALVLPFEITHVRYARGIWSWLGERFGHVRLVRLHERVFDDILQDIVVLMCSDRGQTTSDIEFEAYETVDALVRNAPTAHEKIAVEECGQGEKVFTRALLSEDLRNLVFNEVGGLLQPASRFARFTIGYVSGDKDFFHPSDDDIREFGLRESGSLVRTISRTRDLTDLGIFTSSALRRGRGSELLLLDKRADELTRSEQEYLEKGEKQKVPKRYKCRVRSPWWTVPGVTRPDLILSVFSAMPRLVLNDAALAASNSLLCGTMQQGAAKDFVAAWYTSLTLLECELNVHALGGGVLVLIPGEVSRIRLPDLRAGTDQHLAALDAVLTGNDVRAAYELGDRAVLQRELMLSGAQIDLIRAGVETLRRWRERPR